jgi:EmrB/QacA subfamily drug resistance transporter
MANNTIVNVALPTLQRDLGASNSQLQWVVDGYLLAFAGFLLPAGALCDRAGRKGTLEGGLLLMSLASLFASQTHTAGGLVAARALLGVGAALVMPATVSLLMVVFPRPVERGRAIAIVSSTSGAALAIGPLSGGWLLEHFDSSSVFFVSVPLALATAALAHRLLPRGRESANRPFDFRGAGLAIVGLTSLVWTTIHAGEAGWASPSTAGGLLVALGGISALVRWERRTLHPMVDLAVFRDRHFTTACVAIMATSFSMLGSLFVVTQYLQIVLGHTPLEAGVRLLPVAAASLLVPPLSARLVEHIGTRAVLVCGLLVAALGLLLTATLTATSSDAAVVSRLVVLAVGLALVMAPATESVVSSLSPMSAGAGAALNDASRQVGGALGIAILGSLFASAYSAGIAGADLPNPGRQSIGVANSSPGLVDTSLAFTNAMTLSLGAAAVGCGLGAAVVFRYLPTSRAPEDPALGHGGL